MDDAHLTVSSAATDRTLVTLADLKTSLQITASTYDAELEDIIERVTAAIVGYCNLTPDDTGKATFSLETLVATYYGTYSGRGSTLLLPWRIKVASITSVVEDGVTLASTDYRVLPMAAMLERLDDDYPVCWSSAKIVVTYTAGWIPPDSSGTTMPADLQAAAIHEATAWFRSRGRDPLLRSEAVPDVFSQSWAASGGALSLDGGVLPETAARLARYRRVPF